MSSNTKYSPAPQRDSADESRYTQAPPSYQPSSSADQAALLGGGARSSEDNIPDDFKVRGSPRDIVMICSDDTSLEARSRKHLLTFVWPLCARCTPYCEFLVPFIYLTRHGIRKIRVSLVLTVNQVRSTHRHCHTERHLVLERLI
jgi:hypothetical protein